MKIFIDSNIFIEYFKDNPEAVKLFESVFRITDVKLYINEIVYSEVTYVFIKTVSGKSYYELKKNKRLVVQHGSNFLNIFLPIFKYVKFLMINEDIIRLANEYIIKYGLLPNDALILATCKFYEMEFLLSLDEDFQEPCKKEKFSLISNIRLLENFKGLQS